MEPLPPNLPKTLRFKNTPPRVVTVRPRNPWKVETDPSGHFAYDLDASRAHLYQWRIGQGGVLHELSPNRVDAHSHPSLLRFHPSGRLAYVSCSHGALCQYRVRAGALVPLKPHAIYVVNDPSPLFFDPTGNFACVLTYGDPDMYPSNDRVYVFRVGKDGCLTQVQRIEVSRAESKLSRALLNGTLTAFTLSGSRLHDFFTRIH